MPGKLQRSRRGVLGAKRWQSLEERSSSAAAQLGHPVLARSKTYDPSFCKGTEQAAAATQGPPSPWLSKHAASYHKAFGELAEHEELLACFSCAWQREMPYHGRLYISSHYVCFHSSLLLKDIKAVVPVASISSLKKTNTVLLVPNALSIRTAEGEKFLFVSLRQREATYQLLKSVCKHLQTSSRSDLEQSTPEPDSFQELLALGRAGSAPCSHMCPPGSPEPPVSSWALIKHLFACRWTKPNTKARGGGEWRGSSAGSEKRDTPQHAMGLDPCADHPPQHHHPHLPAADGGPAAVLRVHRSARGGAGAAAGGHGGFAKPQLVTTVSGGAGTPSPCIHPPCTRRCEAGKDLAVTRLGGSPGTESGAAQGCSELFICFLGNEVGLGLHRWVPSSPPDCLGNPPKLWGSILLPRCLPVPGAAGAVKRARGLAGLLCPPPFLPRGQRWPSAGHGRDKGTELFC
ncbi:uncharacterized protein LOC128849252 isoform X2 [Cuculus canorus]|uniref:uncharacterized protein LOC128849252 isoform X2 n=1 Tax=Cuculus canorus TaxID=55661 RepID=UPI0023AA6D12|nr:uncharacterized protein LOC128849252 isoform X2 [Cuculus canorus]